MQTVVEDYEPLIQAVYENRNKCSGYQLREIIDAAESAATVAVTCRRRASIPLSRCAESVYTGTHLCCLQYEASVDTLVALLRCTSVLDIELS